MPKNQVQRIVDGRRGAAAASGGTGTAGHTHDARYYTEAEVAALLEAGLAEKAAAAHGHDHGALTGRDDDDHSQYLLASGARAGATAQPQAFSRSINVNGDVVCAGELYPGGLGYGMLNRTINYGFAPTSHFTGADLPAGYAWAAGALGGTPAYLIPNVHDDYLALIGNAGANGKVFLYKGVADDAAAWQGRSVIGRFRTGITTEIGLRIDDGTDDSYAELFMSGAPANGTQRLDFRWRSGGGAVTTVNSAIIVPCSHYLGLHLFSYWSGSHFYLNGYVFGEDNFSINIDGFSMFANEFLPALGRAGIFAQHQGNYGMCDWFFSNFA